MKSGQRETFNETAWREFSAVFGEEWSKCPFAEELLSAVGEEELAMVICAAAGNHALEWLELPIPALGGETPASCLRTEQGRQRLKAVLMEMPW